MNKMVHQEEDSNSLSTPRRSERIAKAVHDTEGASTDQRSHSETRFGTNSRVSNPLPVARASRDDVDRLITSLRSAPTSAQLLMETWPTPPPVLLKREEQLDGTRWRSMLAVAGSLVVET